MRRLAQLLTVVALLLAVAAPAFADTCRTYSNHSGNVPGSYDYGVFIERGYPTQTVYTNGRNIYVAPPQGRRSWDTVKKCHSTTTTTSSTTSTSTTSTTEPPTTTTSEATTTTTVPETTTSSSTTTTDPTTTSTSKPSTTTTTPTTVTPSTVPPTTTIPEVVTDVPELPNTGLSTVTLAVLGGLALSLGGLTLRATRRGN